MTAGGWVAHEVVATGSSGAVHRCTHPARPGSFVLKRVPLSDVDRPRFEREVDALRALDHPGIVRLHEAGVDAAGGWLVMDLVPGRPLLAYRGQPPLPPSVVLGVAAQVAAAMAHAHERGVAHRDLKPANVLLAPDGCARVVDLGVARITERERLTTTGPGPATPPYAPPEWFGGEAVDDPYPGDVYALGVVTVELLRGAPAFLRCGLDQLAAAKRALPFLEAPGPEDAVALIRRMTSRDPAQRPTMAEIAHALAAYPARAVPADATVADAMVPHDVPSGLGERVGRYRIEAELGRGGAGVVARAWDPLLSRHVAIKCLTSADPSSMERFSREARAVAGLVHPGIVRVLDSGRDGGLLFYAMELVEGGDLRARLAEGPPDLDLALRWTIEVAEALGAAHRAGIVHRDVKPANILLDGGHTARLTDFGAALNVDASRLTSTGQMVGSPMYMAPEQVRGGPADARTDVFGVGGVLYELLAGRPAFPPDHPYAVLHLVLNGETRPLPDHVPEALRRVVARAMALRSEDRYPDMASLVADLERFRAGRAVSAPPLPRARSRWGRPARISLGLAALIAVGIGGSVGLARRERGAVERAAAARLVAAEASADPVAAFEAFASLPEHAGTRALARGWLRHAERLRAGGDPDAARDALASSWSVAEHPEDQQEALIALGGSFLETWDWAGLAGVVQALDALGVREGDELRAALAGSRRDFAGAIAAGGDRTLLERLARATPRPWRAGDPHPFDLDGDGVDEWWMEQDGQLVVLSPERRLTGPVQRFAADTDWYWFMPFRLGGEAHVLAFSRAGGEHAELWSLDPARELMSWPSSTILDGWAGTLVDGGDEAVWFGTGFWERDLWRLARSGAGWVRVDAHESTSAANSDVMAVLAWDPDGDGRRSLFVKTSAWGGFDVRELAPGEAGELTLLNRRKLGIGWNLRVIDTPNGERLAASALGGAGSLVQWSSDQPDGEARGIHILRPDLSTEDLIALPPGRSCWTLYVGDVDGDGVDDLGVGCDDDTLLARQRPEGGFARVWLAGARLEGLFDFDLDGRDEVVLTTVDGDVTWVAGLGDEALPREEVAPPPAPPPAGADRALASAWRRAEALVAMGLSVSARQRLEQIATLDAGAVGAAALVRAADLAVRDRQYAEAAELYARASASPEGAPIGALGAVEAWAADHRFAEAAEALRRWQASGAGDAGERLARYEALAALPAVELDLRGGLPAGVRVEDPIVASWEPSARALRIQATGPGPAVHVPLELVGDRTAVTFELDLERAEWGSGLDVTLAPAAGGPARWALRIQALGGGGNVGTAVILDPGRRWICDVEQRATATPGDRLIGRIDHVASTGELLVHVDGLPERCSAQLVDLDGPLLGAWDLRITTEAWPGRGPTLLVADLEAIRVDGATLRPLDPAVGSDGDWERALALDAAGRWTDADAAVGALVRRASSEELGRRVPQILRTRPRLAAGLRSALGSGWPALFAETWELPANQHPRDREIRAALLAQLGELPAGTPVEVVARLETLRARSLRLEGRVALAKAAVDRALATVDDVREDTAVEVLVEAAATVGDPDRALAFLERALARSPAPEVLADALGVDEAFVALRGHPGWERIDAARRSRFPR